MIGVLHYQAPILSVSICAIVFKAYGFGLNGLKRGVSIVFYKTWDNEKLF